MRKIDNFLKAFNLHGGSSIDNFPKHLLVNYWGSDTRLVFRFMIDPINGNDLNNGQTWESAKKSMDGVLSALPKDLQDREVWILCAGGSNSWTGIQKCNGRIIVRWCGSFMNTVSGNAWVTWAKNGTSKTFSNDACTFLTSQIGFGLCANLMFQFDCYNEIDGQAWGKLILEEDPNNPVVGDGILWLDGYKMHYNIIHLKLKVRTCNYFAVGINTVNASAINIYSIDCELVDGSPVITRTGQWGAFFVILGETSRHATINIGTYGMGYSASFPAPGGKNINLTNCKQFLSTQNSMSTNLFLDLSSINFTPGTSGVAKPVIYVASNFYGGRIVYASALVTLSDNCTNPRYFYDTTTSKFVHVLNGTMRFLNDDAIIKLDTSAVADADLSNSEVTLYLDETLNKLKFKLKYSNGTVKNGEVALI